MKVAIITGASSGMGKWFAYYANVFAVDIDEVWLIGRNKSRLNKVSSKLQIPSKIVAMDLNDDKDTHILMDLLVSNHPDIRLLVNNAGCGMIGEFSAIGLNDHTETILLNCVSLTKVTHICLPFMNKNAHIINLASAAAFLPQPEFAVYAATKSYVLSLSRALSKELAKRDIYVTAVCPGAVKTNFFKHAEKYSKRKAYKNLFMDNERNVVLKALSDAYKNKSVSVIGLSIKILAILSKLLPHKLFMFFM